MAQLLEGVPQTIDAVRQLATEVAEQRVAPLEAARLIVASQIETPAGSQPRFLLIGGAVRNEGRTPSVPVTSVGPNGEPAYQLRFLLPTERGGGVHVVRTTGRPTFGVFGTVSDCNVALQRTLVGGFGVDDSFDLGVAGWRDNGAMHIHERLWREMQHTPDELVGWTEVIQNDGSFVDFPGERDNYASFKRPGHEVVARFPVHAGALLALPAVTTFEY